MNTSWKQMNMNEDVEQWTNLLSHSSGLKISGEKFYSIFLSEIFLL